MPHRNTSVLLFGLLEILPKQCVTTQIMCTQIFIKFLSQDKKRERLQNHQKHILQQTNVVAGKNLPYAVRVKVFYVVDLIGLWHVAIAQVQLTVVSLWTII